MLPLMLKSDECLLRSTSYYIQPDLLSGVHIGLQSEDGLVFNGQRSLQGVGEWVGVGNSSLFACVDIPFNN